jgi:hypothetical protein
MKWLTENSHAAQEFGGSGGGTFAKTSANAGTCPAGVHCAIPWVQTSVFCAKRPMDA